jgi:D-alanine transaminase
LPNVLGKQMAYNEGTYELWQTYDKDIISEGTTSNAFIVKDQNIFTHPQNHCILGGITRDIVIKIAREKKINILEKKFSLGEVYNSDEAFLTSTTVGVLPVVKINNKYILNGKIGKITKKIRIFYEDFINNQLKKHE